MSDPITIVTTGSVGWGNRKSGVEAYGPGGRWAGQAELPNRANANVLYGDLLGDHLDELGAHEGSSLVVVALTRYHTHEQFDTLRDKVQAAVREWLMDEHTRLWADEIRGVQ